MLSPPAVIRGRVVIEDVRVGDVPDDGFVQV
jgi:hypothetical protein